MKTKREHGLDLLDTAMKEFSLVMRRLNGGELGTEMETRLRRNHHAIRSAMNWLEDSEDFERAHRLLDRAGKLARRNFADGCELVFSEGEYHQRCPVALAHNRVGLSIGGVIRRMHCSVCLAHPDDCEHVLRRTYDGVDCQHVVEEIDVEEISLVGRPNVPDARLDDVPLSHGELTSRRGDFALGTPIVCDNCLTPCGGVTRPFEELTERIAESAPAQPGSGAEIG